MSTPEKSPKILIVDDEEQILRALKSILSARKYKVVAAHNGEEAIDLAIDHNPDLIIMDIVLPGIGGVETCRELRGWYTGPILMLTVKSDEEEKIRALDSGADDYLTKPFSAGELLARVRALLRRSAKAMTAPATISAGDLTIDLAHRRVRCAEVEIDLTRIEFDILSYLAQNPDRVLTSKMILEKVWGPEYRDDTQTLRVHMSHLRKKIEPHSAVPRHIMTEPGVGFRFVI
ncbi:response regulator transcription factor [Candidatus Saganbacteria bacterium]|nr:response regulator transcription factor [Candidatus Saganbacteria bacterium]